MAATRLHASRFCASRRVPRKNHDRHIKHKFTQAPEHFHIKATTTKKTGLWSRVRKIQDFSSFFHKNARQHDSTTFFKITEGASVCYGSVCVQYGSSEIPRALFPGIIICVNKRCSARQPQHICRCHRQARPRRRPHQRRRLLRCWQHCRRRQGAPILWDRCPRRHPQSLLPSLRLRFRPSPRPRVRPRVRPWVRPASSSPSCSST